LGLDRWRAAVIRSLHITRGAQGGESVHIETLEQPIEPGSAVIKGS
jgi:hypothetical protein